MARPGTIKLTAANAASIHAVFAAAIASVISSSSPVADGFQ
ncbi:Uncharacterised protein [Mycobacteroides abscessus subsp. abscessus]|nr:Uncharacterised protein [Mycobacteroides abscessus subsp. abscessus]